MNGCFLCSSVNSWLAMKNFGRTRFPVMCSVEMICRRTMTHTMRMTCKKRRMTAMSLRKNHNATDGCIVTYRYKKKWLWCSFEEWTNICYYYSWMSLWMNRISEMDKFLRKVRPCVYLKNAAFPFFAKMNPGSCTGPASLMLLIFLCSPEKNKSQQIRICDLSPQKIWNGQRILHARGRSL